MIIYNFVWVIIALFIITICKCTIWSPSKSFSTDPHLLYAVVLIYAWIIIYSYFSELRYAYDDELPHTYIWKFNN